MDCLLKHGAKVICILIWFCSHIKYNLELVQFIILCITKYWDSVCTICQQLCLACSFKIYVTCRITQYCAGEMREKVKKWTVSVLCHLYGHFHDSQCPALPLYIFWGAYKYWYKIWSNCSIGSRVFAEHIYNFLYKFITALLWNQVPKMKKFYIIK